MLVRVILAVGVVVIPLVLSVQLVRQLAGDDTRQVMTAWVYQNVPRGARVHLNGPYNIPLEAADYATSQTYALDLISLETLRAEGVEYMVLSDAWYFDTRRSWETTPSDYIAEVEAYLATIEAGAVKAVWIERPAWTGYDWIMQTASFWHNPGLTLYCLSEASCAALLP